MYVYSDTELKEILETVSFESEHNSPRVFLCFYSWRCFWFFHTRQQGSIIKFVITIIIIVKVEHSYSTL